MGLFDDDYADAGDAPKVEHRDALGSVLVHHVDAAGMPRDHKGRPLVMSPCPDGEAWVRDGGYEMTGICREGRVPGKRAGTTKACPTCKGRGRLVSAYTRATSHDVLESTFGLEAWRQRLVLIGFKRHDELRVAVGEVDEGDRYGLDMLVDAAFAAGDGHVKAQKGTDLHRLSELVDRGESLPGVLRSDDGIGSAVSLQDRADMAAWVRTRDAWFPDGFSAVEQFVVVDELKVGGTFDRLGLAPVHPVTGEVLCTECDAPKVTDLKTGRLDVGPGKIAQQLAVYSRGALYDPQSCERSPLDVCPHVGLVVNIRPGTGGATMHTVDLAVGWDAVQLSVLVRDYRRRAASMMTEV